MMRMKAFGALAIAAMAVGSLTGFAPVATQGDADPMPEARAFLAQYGADEATQNRLIDGYLAGERWDSMNGAEPVSVREEDRGDGRYTISTFGDGSIEVTRVEQPVSDGPQLRGISQCSASGKQYNGCKIDTWVGAVAMSFYVSYNLGTNTVTSSPWGAGWSIWPDCGSSITYFGKPAANRAQLNVKATMCATLYTTNFELRLTVSAGRANVSWA